MQGSPELSRKSPRTLTKEPKTPQEPSSPAKKRFGLFHKKSKPDLSVSIPDGNSSVRKGPAAGTGHEGYGRYAHRGRKGSIGSSGSTTRARSTSTTRSTPKSVSSKASAKSRPDTDLDDFLLHRLEPVFIPGGGMDGAALMRTQSSQSSGGMSTDSTSILALSAVVTQSSGYSTESLPTSTGSFSTSGSTHHGHNPHFETPAGINTATYSSIPHRSRPVTQNPQVHATSRPSKKAEAGHAAKQPPPHKLSQPPETKQVEEPKSHKKKSSKKGLGLKWPFFHKGSDIQSADPSAFAPQLQATVSPVMVRRPVAHYALVDTDSDPLEDIIHNVEESPPTETESDSQPVEVPAALNIRKASESILLPSPPKLQGEFFGGPPSPKVYFTKATPAPVENRTAAGRPTRLNSVGRIPRVVSRRERKHTPAFQSFSRPFSVAAESPSIAAPVLHRANHSDAGLHREQASNAQRPRPGFDITQPFGDPTNRSVLDLLTEPYVGDEFLTFSPGNDSTLSSSGSDSLAAVTAVVPKPGSDLNEDEVWGEFDDLIDHVLSPETTGRPNSGVTDAEEKFELATMASRALQAELNGSANRYIVDTVAENPTVALTPASPHSSIGSIRLRRSRIVSALHSSMTPSTQPSYSDIIASYHDRGDEGTIKEEESNMSLVPSDDLQSTFLISPSLNPSPSFETCRQRNTVLFDIAERDREGPTAQTNIRSGSLMTSRWLSFGRVLFSPAHNRLKSGGGDQERILVIDGLGNDDWSFYCALTYPNAEVYNLNDGPAPTGPKHPDAWMPPSNHHIIYHSSLDDQFPFPKGYFTVAVLRFPDASSENVQGNVVSECKRVLRPGGYMEMSVLDLDMVNMGVRTRKAVRCLKERTYLSDPNISLKPASDSIQRLLCRYGFDNLRRCIVRIPVAGMIVRTSASSSSASSTNPPSTLAAATATPLTNFSAASTASIRTQSKAHGKSSSNDTDLSLGDLLSDPSPSPSNDESIRKIVAKVGRWWYTRCYEIPVLPNGDVDLSIWADRKVIRECQQRGTGFRLLIAYAQKPSEKRRTASV
ncbi:hypothetical protein FE257_003123 [Aspergillus nanangensis]|uniref:Methyltransferase type 11 domain-containing protein n=1 Tax=Aspergillus nanangensis TaxID=2582783 RepID=A0AAD4GNQ5_ASPNN|nr:hypothetical protein FE257_003123 [Aspergillus nanangensis]